MSVDKNYCKFSHCLNTVVWSVGRACKGILIPEKKKFACGIRNPKHWDLTNVLQFFQQFPQMKIIANTFYRKNLTRENILQLI